ncbi:hypothetical protein K0T92_14365 [Paenibacillus oenotherae]|uniref:Uncharacterized protein n=1 Tax=Paenibacillus oenotherae TaxID=1435645 RepID=A0ABS7D8M1_9BACL|nr:hypothetical protein [Paenibacillus oenotherae]MBW7475926.1 hypothetical protein [Paenibacillus oenotherae]
MNEHINRGPRRPVPQHTPPEPYNNGVIEYQLNDVELAWARAGRTDLIATGEQRGLKAEPLPPRVFKELKPEPVKRSAASKILESIPTETLQMHIKAGLTNREIGDLYNLTASSISSLLCNRGLGGKKGVPRRRHKGKGAGQYARDHHR